MTFKRDFMKQWSAPRAATFTFFTDQERKLYENELRETFISLYVDHRSESTALPNDLMDRVRKIFPDLLQIAPDQERTMHALLWCRWAIRQSTVNISLDCLISLFTWLSEKESEKILYQYLDAGPKKEWRGKSRRRGSLKAKPGYTATEILTVKELGRLPLDDTYRRTWRIKNAPKKAVSEVLVKALIKSLNSLSFSDRNTWIGQNEKADGLKNFAKKSKKEVVDWWRQRFPEYARYSDSYLMRALQEVMKFRPGRCPKPPKKRR